jgi:UDP-N-acetylglucosamine--N-acetylmuramyl-(pentapeptide) pyrophosphoryl-undecaprenol N-acetylglucosamine transferase
MIGYYIHHVGRGHLRNAFCIAAALDLEVTGLSSLPRPDGWTGEWIELDRDDRDVAVRDPSAHGRLHWAPLRDPGLAARMGRIAAWIETTRPAALISDVSVEVALFARLMGIPTVVMALPGDRRDPAHRLGYAQADAVLAAWPAGLADMDRDLSAWGARTHHVGGLSRFAGRAAVARSRPRGRRVLVLQGSGGTSVGAADVAAAATATPDWEWRRLGPGAWVDDPWPALCWADVVVTHAGLGAVADVAAAARPAIVIAEDRPHDEQRATARALAAAGLAVTAASWPRDERWRPLLDSALDIGGSGWESWRTEGAAQRAADIVEATAGAHRGPRTASCASR